MNIQAFIDGKLAEIRVERSESQMTLAKFLELLYKLPETYHVQRIGEPHSYRGYYADLAFELDHHKTMCVAELITLVNDCLYQTYTGYKGGEFTMDENAPLWIANYGSTGKKLMGVDPENGLLLTEEETYD